MVNMKKYNILIALTIAVGAFPIHAQKSAIVGEIAPYVYPQNRPSAPKAFTYIQDGNQYLLLSDDGKRIVSYDTKTGKELETVVDVATTRENKIDYIEGFSVSPDGGKLLLYKDSKAVYRRTFTAQYYVYEIRTRLLRPLSATHNRQMSPLFSPDSRMISFVVDNNIYIKKLDYNTEVAVTSDGKQNEVINGVPDWTYEEEFETSNSMAWAPDNLTLCYIKYNEKNVPMFTFPLYQGTCEPKDEYALYPGIYSYKYPVAGEVNSTVSVHSYDVETRKIKDIALPGNGIEYIPRIHYGGAPERLVVVTLNRNQNHLEFYSVNPKSTVVKSIYTETSKAWINPTTYQDITFNDDNFVIISGKSGYNHLYQYSYSGALVKQLTSGNYDVTEYYGSDVNGNYYYQSAQPTPKDRVVYKVDKKGIASLLSQKEGTSTANFTPSKDYMVLSYSNITTPPIYTLCSNSGKPIRTLEDNASYAAKYKNVAQKEFFTFNSDGNTLNGYIIKPNEFSSSKKYPVVMYQYSGPESQEVVNRWKMDWDFYFASKGYIVVCVDGRGTGGRGTEFSNVVYKQLGKYETIDQVNAAKYVKSLPYVDANHVGMFGWSYGGYETLMCITQPNAPWSAAVAVAPVTSWRYYDTVYTERYMLTPQQNESGYDECSPINRVNNINCPLLIMSGTADDNVHESNTLQFVSALQSEGILCDMLIFPNKNHSIYGCNARAVVYAKMFDWFQKNL
jgi:dipeptidyl-peptidase-4